MKIPDRMMRQVKEVERDERERGTSSATFTITPNATLPTTVVGDFVLSSEKKRRQRRTHKKTDDLDINVYDDLIFFFFK